MKLLTKEEEAAHYRYVHNPLLLRSTIITVLVQHYVAVC